MDYLSYNVAVNLKQIRLSKGMSLGEVAEQTGVSKSMLAQIEKGTANPNQDMSCAFYMVLSLVSRGGRPSFTRQDRLVLFFERDK